MFFLNHFQICALSSANPIGRRCITFVKRVGHTINKLGQFRKYCKCSSAQYSDTQNRTVHFEDLPVFLTVNGKKILEHWRNYSEMGKPKYSRLNLSNCQIVHHTSHTDWPGVKPRPCLRVKMAVTNQRSEPWQAYIRGLEL